MKIPVSAMTLALALGAALATAGFFYAGSADAGAVRIISAAQDFSVPLPAPATGNQRYIITFNEIGVLH